MVFSPSFKPQTTIQHGADTSQLTNKEKKSDCHGRFRRIIPVTERLSHAQVHDIPGKICHIGSSRCIQGQYYRRKDDQILDAVGMRGTNTAIKRRLAFVSAGRKGIWSGLASVDEKGTMTEHNACVQERPATVGQDGSERGLENDGHVDGMPRICEETGMLAS